MAQFDEAASGVVADGQAHLRQLRHWQQVSSWFWAQLPALLLLVLVVWGTPLRAQNDVSTVALSRPVSGCSLTATESVTVRLFNYGSTLPAATSFNLSYRVILEIRSLNC